MTGDNDAATSTWLSKREVAALHALQGLLAGGKHAGTTKDLADMAWVYACALFPDVSGSAPSAATDTPWSDDEAERAAAVRGAAEALGVPAEDIRNAAFEPNPGQGTGPGVRTLTEGEAAKLHAALGAIGVPKEKHYRLATGKLRREITSLTQVTTAERQVVVEYAERWVKQVQTT